MQGARTAEKQTQRERKKAKKVREREERGKSGRKRANGLHTLTYSSIHGRRHVLQLNLFEKRNRKHPQY